MKSNSLRTSRNKTVLAALLCSGLMSGYPLSTIAAENISSTLHSQQTGQATGVVTDANGDPIIGASVVVKGTTNGVITDLDGKFTLSNVADGTILQISYIGYTTTDIKVTGKTLKVILKEDTEVLDEVVVVGYGVVKKSDVTGALTRVTDKTIKERPVQNALQAMQGKAAGVQISSNNRPGELGEVRIRGNRSITADNDPLYVIDGIPLTAGSMSDINPNDIQSIEILKDASATAIYGSRGANGVILVTTKRGQTGKVTINYDGTVSIAKLHSLTEWMNAGENIDWQRQAAVNAGAYNGNYGNAPDPTIDGDKFFGISKYPYMDPVFKSAFQFNSDGTPMLRDASDYEKNVLGYADQVPVYDSSKIPTTPWRDYASRTALTHNHQISLSAGGEKSRLYMSVAYLNQEATAKDQDYERYTININGDIQATKWLKVGVGANLSHSIQNYGIVNNSSNTTAKDSYGLACGMEPYAPAYDENGELLRPTEGPSKHNILLNINEAQNETRYYGAMVSSFAEATILPWLKWRTNFGTQFRSTRKGSYYGNDFTNPLDADPTAPNVAYNEHGESLSWTLENLIYINKTFNEIHTFGATLLQSAEYSRAEGLNARGYECKFPSAIWYGVGSSNTSKGTFGASFNEQKRSSYMVRLNYNLLNRYLLTATGRWDGASVLAVGNKWDFFPSAALAWKVNQEKFLTDIKWLNELKVRVGYGVTGNASIKPYQTGGAITSSYASIPFGQGPITSNTVGAKANVLANPGLGWEKTASTNLGIDFGFLNNRITGSMEYYVAKTSDLLLNKSIPMMTGYTSILSNIGKTQNKGFELTLSTVNISTKDFTWRTDFTFSTNKEEIMELTDGKNDDRANGWFIGRPTDEVWTKKYDRLWQNTDEDRRLLALYKGNSITMLPGQAKLVDQPLVEVPKGTEGAITKQIEYQVQTGVDAKGQPVYETKQEEVTYMNNGFGTIDNEDNKFLGSFRPKWEGGFTTTFTYKNWELSSFFYGRFGGLYYGLNQNYGARKVDPKDVWSPTNTEGKYPQPLSGGQAYSDYSSFMNYTKGNMIVVRNISLSYAFPQSLLKKVGATSCSVYAQVLNPFIFGSELIRNGVNPDDITGWSASSRSNGDYKYIGGQTNNTCITKSFVIGFRLGF